MPKFTISALSWYDNTTGPPWREKLKNQEGYTTLHSIYYVPLLCAVVCPMTMFAGSWLEVRRLLVWSAHAAAAKGTACIKISSLGFRFCWHHSENHLYCSFRGLLHSKPSDSPKKLFRWSFLRFFLDKGRNSKHANHGYRLKRKSKF